MRNLIRTLSVLLFCTCFRADSGNGAIFEAARAKMKEIVAQNLSGATAKITFEDGYPAMTPAEANYSLLKQLDQVSQDLRFGSVEAFDPGERGAGDIAFVSNIVPGLTRNWR